MNNQPPSLIWTLVALLASRLTSSIIHAACPIPCSCQPHYIDCSNAGFTAIPWNLPDPVGLHALHLQGNDIQELIAAIVSYNNLEELDLSSNGMQSIDDAVFGSLPNLKTLRLQDNALKTLARQTFEGLASLDALHLSNNDLERIDGSPFTDLTKLQVLDLSGNAIATISPIAFLGLVNLRSLSVARNALKAVPVDSLVHISNLRHLTLNDNDIEELPAACFNDLKNLQSINLDANAIHAISEFAFGNKFRSQINILSLRNNDLSMVPTASIARLTSVETIALSGNPLIVVDPDAFKGLEELRTISLDSMPNLEVIRSFSFSELRRLKSVELHSNPKLRSIEQDAFIASQSIERVDLHSNALETLDVELFSWEKLRYLDLRFNRFNCDCYINFLPTVLQSFSNASLTSQVLCAAPPQLASKVLMKLTPDHFQCDVEVKKLEERHIEDRAMIGIIAGTSCLLLVITIALMWRSRYTMFGAGPIPVAAYRVPGSRTGNGRPGVAHRRGQEEGRGGGEDTSSSDDRLAIVGGSNEQLAHTDPMHEDPGQGV